MPSLPAVSREFLYLPGVQAFDLRSPDAVADPTTLPAKVAFLTDRAAVPQPGDWWPAQWWDKSTLRILLGPTAVQLTPGLYYVWLTILGAVEQPERMVGSVTIKAAA